MTDRRGIEWRARARERLEPVVADVDAERTTLGWFDVERLLDGRDPSEGFRWSALFMRRTIGLPALQELAAATHDGRQLTPIEAVTRVVERMVAVGREGWADREGAEPEDWLRSVGEGGRAAAIRDAVTWVTACRTQLMWPPRDIRARGEGTAYATVRKDVLSLSTRIDLGSWKQPGVIEPSAPTEHTRASLGYIALVRTMDTGVIPASVTALHLASGDRTTVVIDDAALDEVLDLCTYALTRWADEIERGAGG
jgi:hypothetical protein